MLDVNQIVQVIQQTGGTISALVTQVAFFFAIQAAAGWLSFTLPCLLLFGILLKIARTQKALGAENSSGLVVFAAWLFLAASMFTGVRGMAHVAQAALSPVVYVASEIGGIEKLMEGMKK